MRLALLLIALAAPAPAPAAAASSWTPPVPGPVARPFSLGQNPFAPGRHRGVDLRARPGTAVRAPCTGRVAFAGRAPSHGGAVSLRCGPWRVTHLPLTRIAVRRGTRVAAGARLGVVAAGHGRALHLGVRREADRFAYTDPIPFLHRPSSATPPIGPAGRARRGPLEAPPVAPHPPAPHAAASPPAVAARHPPTPHPAASAPAGVLPWPAWAGLGLVAVGALGAGGVARRRRPRTVGEVLHTP